MTTKPADALKRRVRSELSEDDCMAVMRWFAPKIDRLVESSDPSAFKNPNRTKPAMGSGHINVQLMVKGSFGVADDFFEAIRVLAGYKLPRKETP